MYLQVTFALCDFFINFSGNINLAGPPLCVHMHALRPNRNYSDDIRTKRNMAPHNRVSRHRIDFPRETVLKYSRVTSSPNKVGEFTPIAVVDLYDLFGAGWPVSTCRSTRKCNREF